MDERPIENVGAGSRPRHASDADLTTVSGAARNEASIQRVASGQQEATALAQTGPLHAVALSWKLVSRSGSPTTPARCKSVTRSPAQRPTRRRHGPKRHIFDRCSEQSDVSLAEADSPRATHQDKSDSTSLTNCRCKATSLLAERGVHCCLARLRGSRAGATRRFRCGRRSCRSGWWRGGRGWPLT